VVVMGGGVAGLATALLLTRDGHRVTLVERDEFEISPPEASPLWSRKGIPQFLQPHAFIPRGCLELRNNMADVYSSLLGVGAHVVDVRAKIPGPTEPGDEDLQYLAVRRPLIEWALREAVRREPHIDIRAGARIEGIGVGGGRVATVKVDGNNVDAELVVDALGRRSPVNEWLQQAGVDRAEPETSECAVIYYSRYYRLRSGFDLPDGPWFLSPRGDLGYMGYATFPGDNRTFAAVLAVPTGVPQWRALQEPKVFEAAVAQIPPLARWADPSGVDPITEVMPMAGLRNTLRAHEATSVGGLVTVGDALCHTDPVLAHGLAFAFIHARELTEALRRHPDLSDACTAYAVAPAPAVRERYDLATALDEQRHRLWIGEAVDFSRADGDYALFSMVAVGAVAAIDPDVSRVFLRRIGLLDSTAVLDTDREMQTRVERIFQQITLAPRPMAGPPTNEMLAVIQTAGADRRNVSRAWK